MELKHGFRKRHLGNTVQPEVPNANRPTQYWKTATQMKTVHRELRLKALPPAPKTMARGSQPVRHLVQRYPSDRQQERKRLYTESDQNK